jgi:hypothetical protein
VEIGKIREKLKKTKKMKKFSAATERIKKGIVYRRVEEKRN